MIPDAGFDTGDGVQSPAFLLLQAKISTFLGCIYEKYFYIYIRNGASKALIFCCLLFKHFWAREYNNGTDQLFGEAVLHQKEAKEMYHRMPWSVFMLQY